MNEKKQIALLVALVIGGSLLIYYVWRQPGASTQAAKALDTANYVPLAVENPALQREKLDTSRKTEYKSSGRDLFSEVAPPPVVVVAAAAKKRGRPFVGPPSPPPPPPPPPPPTLPANLKFFGYGTVPNGTSRRAFLTDGDEIYIVGEGDTLLQRFRVVKISNNSLEFEEIASGRRNFIALQEDAGPPAPAA